jgi:hypothetical protein
MYIEQVQWEWNDQGNLEGFMNDVHRFTWQPHGSQFTIKEKVPENALKFRLIRTPDKLDKKMILKSVGFNEDWIEIVSGT